MTTLRVGSEGQSVLDVQCALAAAGVYPGDLDGCFGAGTEAAIRAFQKEKNLPVTGVVDEKTAAALGLENAAPVACKVPDITARMIAPMFPGTPLENIEANLPHVLNALAEAGLCDKPMVLMALATIRAETSCFLPISEHASPLNTSPGGHPFDLYDQRIELGNQGAPDGANFRGRGFIQLTGRTNFRIHGRAIGLGDQLLSSPVAAHRPQTAAKLLASFLKAHETEIRYALAQHDFPRARRLVNGGSNGLAQFRTAFETGLHLLPDTIAVREPVNQPPVETT